MSNEDYMNHIYRIIARTNRKIAKLNARMSTSLIVRDEAKILETTIYEYLGDNYSLKTYLADLGQVRREQQVAFIAATIVQVEENRLNS